MSSCGVPLHRSEWSPINSKTKTASPYLQPSSRFRADVRPLRHVPWRGKPRVWRILG